MTTSSTPTMSTRILNCIHCDAPVPALSGHDEIRVICPTCVNASLRPGGRSLSFPRDVQDELPVIDIQPEVLAVA